MRPGFRKSSATRTHTWKGKHRFEHWYRDNTLYFITARVRDRRRVFAAQVAKDVFWDRFWSYAKQYRLYVWIVTLMDNHFHVIAHVEKGDSVPKFMQKLHGSVAKLVNDLLPDRHLLFWRASGNRDYYDGCLRNEKQVRRAYKYTLKQAVRAGLVKDLRKYEHTKVLIHLERGIKRAHELKSIPIHVPYERYRREGRDPRTGRFSDQ